MTRVGPRSCWQWATLALVVVAFLGAPTDVLAGRRGSSSYSYRSPSYSTPKSISTYRSPSYSTPRSRYTYRAPSYSTPKSSSTYRSPNYSTPRSSYTYRAPSYSTPKSSSTYRSPSYSTPRSSYTDRAPSYSTPKSSSTYRSPSYSTPRSSYTYRSPRTSVRGFRGSTGAGSTDGIERDSQGEIKRSGAARRAFMRETGYPNGRPGYVIDHVIPLARGGPDDPRNMQWQTVGEAKAKDKWELGQTVKPRKPGR